MMENKEVVGWLEWCSLPQLKIYPLRVKIDTGACSSSLHATNIKSFKKEGKEMVSFITSPHPNNDSKKYKCEVPLHSKKIVRTSNKEAEERLFIRTKIKIGAIEKTIKINLTNRKNLRNKMLLGRNAMHNLVVDPRERYLHGNCPLK